MTEEEEVQGYTEICEKTFGIPSRNYDHYSPLKLCKCDREGVQVNCVSAHMSEEAACHHGGVPLAGLQLRQEVVAVEVVQLLQVAKDDAPLAPQILGDVGSVQQGEVVGEDIGQRADVLPLSEQQLLQDSLQPPGQTKRSLKSRFI